MRMDGRKVKGMDAGGKPPTISEMCKEEIPKPATPLDETTNVFHIAVKQDPAAAPRKVKMSCRKRVSIRLNSLESIWYCIVVIVVTVFLLGDALRQYSHYKHLEWPDQPPKGELGLYGLLIFSAFALIVLFVPTQIFKVGNRANDQDKLGIIKARGPETMFRKASVGTTQIKAIRQYVYKIRGVSKHMGPIGATLHMLSAFCLLLPLMFLQSRAIENGLLPVEMIWKSEVAVISAPAAVFESSAEAAVHHGSLSTQAPPSHSADMSPNRDPFRVFMVTINYLNYMVPLFFYAIRYAEVFWVSHKGFAFLFSAQLMMNAIHYALGFIGMSIMYKLSTYVHGDHNAWGVEDSPGVAPPTFLIMSFLSMNITVFLSAVTFYLFGYTRYKISESVVVPADTTDRGKSRLCILRFNGLLPHVGAFIVFIILVICKGFFIVEYFIVYRWLTDGDGRIMCCIVFDILYLVMWFFMWVVFTIKLDWNFGFFSHPTHPHRAIDAQSDSDDGPGLRSSSNSDLEMNSDLSKLNHFCPGSQSLRQTSEESETSFGNNVNTSLLSHQDQNHDDQTNRGLLEDEVGRRGMQRYADVGSSGAVANRTKSPKKGSLTSTEVVTSPSGSDDSKLLSGVSIEIDSPTASSPMLPIST